MIGQSNGSPKSSPVQALPGSCSGSPLTLWPADSLAELTLYARCCAVVACAALKSAASAAGSVSLSPGIDAVCHRAPMPELWRAGVMARGDGHLFAVVLIGQGGDT